MALFKEMCCCNQRHYIVFLIALSFFQSTTTTFLLSHVVSTIIPPVGNFTSAVFCNYTTSNETWRYIDKRGTNYGWTKRTSNDVLRFFYLGYMSVHIIAGYIADKYGGKHITVAILASITVIQFVTPVLVHGLDGDVDAMKALRLIQGIAEGMRVPVCMSLFAHWIPRTQRCRMFALCFMGMLVGRLAIHLLVFSMYEYRDWALPFYLNGAVGTLFTLLWLLTGSSYPSTCPYITHVEKFYLQTVMRSKVTHGNKPIPLRRMLFSLRIWAMTFALTAHLWTWHSSQMFVKTYMKKVLDFDLEGDKVFSTMPTIVAAGVTLCGGFISDWAVNRGKSDKTFLRKVFTSIGLMGNPIYMLVGSYTVCHTDLGQFFFIMAMSFEGCCFIGIRLVPVDLAANYAGFLTGLCMTPASVLVMFGPTLIHYLVPQATLMGYRNFFYLNLGIATSCCLIFVVLGDAVTQSWNTPEKHKKSHRK